MKKIIKGRLYDTDKAKRLGFDGGGEGFSRWCEELYQKRTGEYFLYGEGGPMTKYSVSVSNNTWSGGEKIIPLTPGAAREWAENHLTADEYEEIFGIPDEAEGERVTLCVQLPAAMVAKLRAGAAENRSSLTAYMEALISKAM